MPERIYITTPIYYVNAEPHLGHAYTTIVADVWKRFYRLMDREVFLQTGTDEHGHKVVEASSKKGMDVRDYVDMISGKFQNTWPKLDIEVDNFIRTTSKEHIRVVQEILQKVYDKGDIYMSDYKGLYCFGCERFLTEKELVDGLCPDHKKAPEPIKEKNYFFRMSKYQDWLIEAIDSNPDLIQPERYRNEVLSFLKEPLEDLCISRPKSRLSWGIELPFDKDYVTYVWFDALINYISGIGYPDNEKFRHFWPYAHHLIAKDILKPHAIYWPTMLKAADVPLFSGLHVHGYWNIQESKMSKSLGNVVDPIEISDTYGIDSLRYFLMREMVYGLDASFSEDALVGRINADLANDLGNLFSRSLTMVKRFASGEIPVPVEGADPLKKEIDQIEDNAVTIYMKEMEILGFQKALVAVWDFIRSLNKYIVQSQPWELAKQGKKEHLNTHLYTLCQKLLTVSLLLWPIMPTTSKKMQKMLGMDEKFYTWGMREKLFDRLKGQKIGEIVPLFPRIDIKKKAKDIEKQKGVSEKDDNLVSIEEFSKIELRVGVVLEAERVPKSKKLIRLKINADRERTIVAGVAEHISPEELVGEKVLVVTNLKPAKLMGIKSEGMLLVAVEKEKMYLPSFPEEVPPGTRVR